MPLVGLETEIVNDIAPTDTVQFSAEEADLVEVEVGEFVTQGSRWTGIIDWGPAEVSSGVPVLRMSQIPAVWYGKDLRLNVRLSRSHEQVYVFVIRVSGELVSGELVAPPIAHTSYACKLCVPQCPVMWCTCVLSTCERVFGCYDP